MQPMTPNESPLNTMALLLFIGYLLVFIHNQLSSDPVSMLWLNAIGISVQFSWEAVLLVTGIRNPGFGPLVIDSLIETNLGLPYLYFIQKWILMEPFRPNKSSKALFT